MVIEEGSGAGNFAVHLDSSTGSERTQPTGEGDRLGNIRTAPKDIGPGFSHLARDVNSRLLVNLGRLVGLGQRDRNVELSGVVFLQPASDDVFKGLRGNATCADVTGQRI